MKYNGQYSEIFLKISHETATLIFIKKNGKVRTMLATRNMGTASLESVEPLGGMLNAYDMKNSKENGNIAVVDLMIDEVRSFNIERLIDIQWHGVVNDEETLASIKEGFNEFNDIYFESQNETVNIDLLT